MFCCSSVDAFSSRYLLVPCYDETQDETFLRVAQSASVSFCYQPLMLCFMQTKEWRLLCRWGSQKTTRHLITTMENVSCAQCCSMKPGMGPPRVSKSIKPGILSDLIVVRDRKFKKLLWSEYLKSESDWSVDLKSVQVPLSWMMAPQNWFLMTNQEKALRMLANTVKLFLLPWMRQALRCQMEISYWKSLVSAKIPIQGVYQI